jgi:hypothetical protein
LNPLSCFGHHHLSNFLSLFTLHCKCPHIPYYIPSPLCLWRMPPLIHLCLIRTSLQSYNQSNVCKYMICI